MIEQESAMQRVLDRTRLEVPIFSGAGPLWGPLRWL